MSTIRPFFDSFLMERLKIEITKKIGWTVYTKPDCHKLSEIILNNGFGQ